MIARHLVILATLCLCGTSANALTMKECSAKYKAAQTAGTLNGQKWNDFRKAECGAEAAATPASAPAGCAACRRAGPEGRCCQAGTGGGTVLYRQRDVPERRFAKVFERERRQGPDAHVS